MKLLKQKVHANNKSPNIERIYKLILALLAYIITLFIIFGNHIENVDIPVIGEIVMEPFIVTKDIQYENSFETRKKIEYSISQISPIFNMYDSVSENDKMKIENVFRFIRMSKDDNISIENMHYQFVDQFSIPVNRNILAEIIKSDYKIDYESKSIEIINKIYSAGVLSTNSVSKITLRLMENNGISINRIENLKEEQYRSGKDEIIFLKDISTNIYNIAKENYKELQEDELQVLTSFVNLFVRENIFYNSLETSELIAYRISTVEPVYTTLNKGYIVLNTGEKLTEEKVNLVRTIYKDSSEYSIVTFIGNSIFILFIFIFMGFIMVLNKLDLYKDTRKYTIVIFEYLTILLLVYLVMNTWSNFFNGLYLPLYIYTFIPMFSIINVMLGTKKEISIAITTSLALLMANIVGASISETFTLILVSISASIFAKKKIKNRSDIMWLGLLMGLAFVLASIINGISSGNIEITYHTLILSLLAGIIQSLIVMISLPLYEDILGYATVFKLQELANLNNPLLRELQRKAPGTYHHSIALGSLVETIAKEIGENSQLACVSGYYHDIGKMENPSFFIENTTRLENRHNGLRPTISAAIIKSHVKSGVEIAKRNKLPKELINAILEHHGTSFIRYFYYLAVRENPDTDKSLFQYPGPRPQSKITGIIMIIDSIEAASRTLESPKKEEIQLLIESILNEKIVEGELSESGLTLKDIGIIKKIAFRQVITAFHERVKYPDIIDKQGRLKAK